MQLNYPSQFMENYCWEWSVIRDMSYNKKTNTYMPKKLFNKFVRVEEFPIRFTNIETS